MSPLSVAVVIPTLNASTYLPRLLDSLESQTLRPSEIIVVDSESIDGTALVARRYPSVTVLEIPRYTFDHGLTRDMAFRFTSSDLVCFLTQDALPGSNSYLENLVSVFSDPSVAVASGRQVARNDASTRERLVREYSYPSVARRTTVADIPALGIRAFYVSDTCSAYRRSCYLAVDGFGKCHTNEDMLMAAKLLRSGWSSAYVPSAWVYHSHNLSFRSQFLRNSAIGAFLYDHRVDLLHVSGTGEGSRVALQVFSDLLNDRSFVEAARFSLDCFARILGALFGRIRSFFSARLQFRQERGFRAHRR